MSAFLMQLAACLVSSVIGFFAGLEIGYRPAVRFPDKIPCAGCGDLELLAALGQCSACGRLFCCGCADPMENERRLVCEKCEEATR